MYQKKITYNLEWRDTCVKNMYANSKSLKSCIIFLKHSEIFHYSLLPLSQANILCYSVTGTLVVQQQCKSLKKCTQHSADYNSWFGRAANANCTRETSFDSRLEIVCLTQTSPSVKTASVPPTWSAWATWP